MLPLPPPPPEQSLGASASSNRPRCPRCGSANVESPNVERSDLAKLLPLPLVLLSGWGAGVWPDTVSRYRCQKCGEHWSRLNFWGVANLVAVLVGLVALLAFAYLYLLSHW
jgi:hypothetical protein